MQGRPRGFETRRRRREFIELLSSGSSWRDAARIARVDAGAVLRMLDDEPAFRALAAQLLAEPVEAVA